MLFNSLIFLFAFLPIALVGWYNIKNEKWRLLWITACSLVFYGYWNYKFVSLMLVSILIDFVCGEQIEKWKENNRARAKNWVIVSVTSNLAILGFFKYFNFFIDSFYSLPFSDGFFSKPVLEVVLPVGISFYTFQSMSYSIDLYRGHAQRVKSLLHFSAYVTLFPQLIAGPIVRYQEMDFQLRNLSSKINWSNFNKGIVFFVLGLFKKLYIADTFAKFSDLFFENYLLFDLQMIVTWFGLLTYTFQIYFDFSAYSEMAIGLGLMLGFKFPQNFNSPYKASSFSDFWRRWHITLSVFLRDNLYIPLGGNRKGKRRTMINLFLTMLLGGLWHGASWLFVIWGALHGVYLAIEKKFDEKNLKINKTLKSSLVFLLVSLAWIFFRSKNLEVAWQMLQSCFGFNGIESLTISKNGIFAESKWNYFLPLKYVLFVLFMIGFVRIWPNVNQVVENHLKRYNVVLGLLIGVLLYICILVVSRPSPFIYFQF